MKIFSAIVALTLLSTPACAAETSSSQEVKLTQEQVKELLVGATVKGVHYGKETRQYFSESGLTLYAAKLVQPPFYDPKKTLASR